MNTIIARYRATSLAGLLAACSILAQAQSGQSGSDDYIRHARAGDGSPVALEVAIAGFEGRSGERVDLVSAVHVADRDYFSLLDRRLADYEVVLYELVGEPGQVEAPRGAAPSLVGLLQGGMKNALGLAFQLDVIDYQRDNMVHADLTPSAFSASMRDRSESFGGMMFRLWAMALAQQGAGKTAGQEADFLKALFAPDLLDHEIVSVALKKSATGYTETARQALDDLAALQLTRRRVDAAAQFELAERTGLTAYDAAYLELALREGLALATLDKALLDASHATGVRRL